MADPQIAAFLSTCPSPESGCFASDQEALEAMLYFSGDSGIRAELMSVGTASTSAAEAGIPLNKATYKPVKIESDGRGTHLLGNGEPRKIIVEVDEHDDIGKLRQQVAKCAYVCGATAVGCPLRTAP